jgi:sulfatase maturation enzyme AslB (radical SAM superfamily)
MGAIAGSSLLDCQPSAALDTVTLTVNNACNLSCPHCYLQYDQAASTPFDVEIFPLIERSTFRHLAIVGKEPLFDKHSLQLCLAVAEICQKSGKTISLITNGLNLSAVPDSFFEVFSFIDISLDGGMNTYSEYRKGSIAKLRKSLDRLGNQKVPFNALHVLNSATFGSFDDLLAVRAMAPFQRIVFSPYIETANHGTNTVGPVALESILHRLRDSTFVQTVGAVLLVHDEHLRQARMPEALFAQLATEYGISDNLCFIPADPVDYGVVRVTFDGLVLTPYAALHPRHYAAQAHFRVSELRDTTLQSAFTRLREENQSIQ